MSERIGDLFDDIDDFERLLGDAESQAKTERDQEFVADVRARYEVWGDGMYLSEKQRGWLERIVG